jgi:putative redox protein
MEASVTWTGKMGFDGKSDSGHLVHLDSDPSIGGDDRGLRPMELIAIGLAGCTAMDVISILGKKRQEITGFEVQVHAGRAAEHPKVFTEAEIEYLISGRGVDETAVQRAIELSALRYCPAQAMLGKVMPIRMTYRIFEESGESQGRRLIVSGEWLPPVEAEAA